MENRSNEQLNGQQILSNSKETITSFKEVNWGRLFEYLKPYWKEMGAAIVALLASTLPQTWLFP